MPEFVDIKREADIAVVALNRPKAYNAFHMDMITELATELRALATDESANGVVLTGNGRAFCAGGDIRWVMQFDEKPAAMFHRLASQFHHTVVEIRRMKKPVIAAVNGIAAGGGFSLALACDFRVMAGSAVLRQAYTSSGLSIDGGGSFMLPRLVGFARAMEIAAFDNSISAEQALDWGLVTQLAEDETVLDEAKQMARRIAEGSVHSFAWAKCLLNNAYSNTLESHLELEREGLAVCADHPDGREGLAAFSQGRRPDFRHSSA